MKTYTKTVRFYDTKKDQIALSALSNYADYGFNNANEMMVNALYEFTERCSDSSNIDIDLLADRLAKRLAETGITITSTSEAIPTPTVPSGLVSLNSTDKVMDNNIDDIMSDILSY